MPTRQALTTRFLDFWLLGGASLLVWLAMVLASSFRSAFGIDQQFRNLTFTALSLALILNYPHFLMSYKFAYGRGLQFVFKHWWQLIAVPIGLAGLFTAAYSFYDLPVSRLTLVSRASAALSPWGVNSQVLSGPRLGDLLLTAAFNLMILTIGWHYTMQVFGCMMVYARFDGYSVTSAQRRLTKAALLSIWIMSVVENNLHGAFRTFGGFSYSSFDLPDAAGPLAEFLVAAGFVAVGYNVFYANYRATARLPSPNMVIPFVAMFVWWVPLTRQDDFYFLMVPLFHSLQYLAFAYKVEDTRLRAARYRELRGTALIVGVVIAGWLAFELVPGTLDARLRTLDGWGLSFFVIAAMLFINIHHYFIDNVAWRLNDATVRQYLFESTPSPGAMAAGFTQSMSHGLAGTRAAD